MASVRQIAQRVGVSTATVYRALNNNPTDDPETRRKVLVSLARDKTAQETYTQFFARKGLRGVILRSFEESREVCAAIAREGFPAVVAADRFKEPEVNYICCDSRDDSRRAVQHLIDLGHRRIALGMHAIRDTDHLDRKAGYEQAMLENGLAIDPSYEIEILGSMEGGAGLITRLMSLPVPPTAVFLTDPLATVGALRRCLELGIRVPADLSIVGFDDSDIRRHTYPMFSAVCQDAEMLGFESARWLCRVLTDPDNEPGRSFRITRQTRLEINQSTGRPTEDPFRVLPDGTRTPVLAEDIPVVTVRRRTS